MMNALIISRNKAAFKTIKKVLTEHGIHTGWSDNTDDALTWLTDEPSDVVIIDENVPGMACRSFVENAIRTNPMMSCIVASPSSTEEFASTYKGLGILMQFSDDPGQKEVQCLCDHISRIIH